MTNSVHNFPLLILQNPHRQIALATRVDGIKLYRIREALPSLNGSSIDIIVQKSQVDLPEAIKKILMDIAEIVADIDIIRDTVAIESLREHTEKEESLLFANPEIAIEWNYEKNGDLRPEFFLPNSQKTFGGNAIKAMSGEQKY